jgi:excisionase family DNA binding protein
MQTAVSLDNRGMKRNTSPAFFTERSLAAYLAVSDRTIRNWIRRGELPSYKLGARDGSTPPTSRTSSHGIETRLPNAFVK